MARRLRSGFTTGACAAAAAKAATLLLQDGKAPDRVEIPFPDGSRHGFALKQCRMMTNAALASVIKDAGDDPDVTNGAEIMAEVRPGGAKTGRPTGVSIGSEIELFAGNGVGYVTKPGLAVNVGEPAINPIPRKMIAAAVREAAATGQLQITVSVPCGEELAIKTLNSRLGIVGGLSILGTTGIVRPVSAEAWTATIQASMAVARETGLKQVVLSTGRTSERGAQTLLDLPEEAYVMMGDYLQFSLHQAREYGFSKVILAGMWAKITKAALKVPQTHVRNGALEMREAAQLLTVLGAVGSLQQKIENSNTAREMLEHLLAAERRDIIQAVCAKAGDYCHEEFGGEVEVVLVSNKTKVIERQ